MVAISNERNSANPDQIIVGTLHDVYEGELLERIPEHVTLLQWFSLNGKYQSAFENALLNLIHDTPPMELVGDARAKFGPNKDIDVTTLRLGTLASFHTQALGLVRRLEGRVHSDYVGDRYAPHVTDTNDFQYPVGERRLLERIQLISMDRETGMRNVDKVLPLTGGTHGAPTARF